jgi:CRP-like cAMP-binding protein
MPGENLLLAVLPREERRRLDPFLEPVELDFGQTVIEPDAPIAHVYFLADAISSTLQELSDGSSIETGLMGVEGMVGIQLWLRVPSTPSRTIIQMAGRALRMTAEDFAREVRDAPSPLNDYLARYTHAFLNMTSQAAACNRLHQVEARLCRWLALVHARVRRDEFAMRQEFLAMMLGVQRPTVSIAAGMLAKAGLISYSRGQLRVEDGEGLREGACECLELMEAQMDRIYGRPWRELVEELDRQSEQ